MTPADAAELSQCYLLPEAAAPLILAACQRDAPEGSRRALQALLWLDPEIDDPFPLPTGPSASDGLQAAVAVLCERLIYHSDARTRSRCARLVSLILREAQ